MSKNLKGIKVVFIISYILVAILANLSESVTISSSSRNSVDDEDILNKDEETIALRAQIRGAASQISKPSYLNEVVDTFFASSNDDPLEDTNLKDEIKILANTEVLKSFLVAVRRQLHRHPELMYQGN